MLKTLVKWLTKLKILGRGTRHTSTLTVDQLRTKYSPVRVLRYSEARSFLYGVVDNVDGVVAGIYGSLVVEDGARVVDHVDAVVGAIDNAADVLMDFDGELDEKALKRPSAGGVIRKEAKEEGINLEHLWPQSMLKKNNARKAVSDMHHMVPAGVEINGLRGILAFGEVDGQPFGESDESVVRKQRLKKGIKGAFEPQDVSKGNVARALFYIALVDEIQTSYNFQELLWSRSEMRHKIAYKLSSKHVT